MQPLRSRRDYGETANINLADDAVDTRSEKVAVAVAEHLFSSPTMRLASLAKEREARLDLSEVPKEVLEMAKPSEIEQGFLVESEDGDTMVRIRREVSPEGETKLTMTAKHYPSHAEAETAISQEIFDGLSDLVQDMERKKRYRWNGWDIDDIATGRRAGRVVAEYEFPEGTTSMEIPQTIRDVVLQGPR